MTWRRRTLRQRIILYFIGYLSILLLAYSATLHIAVMEAQDVIFVRQIKSSLDSIIESIETHDELPNQISHNMSVYDQFGKIPSILRNHVVYDREGLYEINADGLNYHVAVSRRPSNGQMIYLLYDVGTLEFSDKFEQITDLVLLGIGLAILIAGWFLASAVASLILRPVTRLAESMKDLSPETENLHLATYDTSDEIGTLAKTIDSQFERITSLTRREREFTSHASHELRTPVSVIKGAVEILRERTGKENDLYLAPLARIDRSVAGIESLINTFLFLARHDEPETPAEPCDLMSIIKEVVDAHIHLLENKPVRVEVPSSDSIQVLEPAAIVSIAIGNLVRNAFQYTLEGRVTIALAADRVSVSDTGPGLEQPVGVCGIGLIIVRRLCERMHWDLTISSNPDGGTCAELAFRSSAKRSAPTSV